MRWMEGSGCVNFSTTCLVNWKAGTRGTVLPPCAGHVVELFRAIDGGGDHPLLLTLISECTGTELQYMTFGGRLLASACHSTHLLV